MTATSEPRQWTAMLVDDDHADLMLHGRLIKRFGQFGAVLSFEYAEEAFEYLRNPDREEVDVVFLDINMPRMSGFEFLESACQEFGDRFTQLIVVMLTTSLDANDREQAASYEMVRQFCKKPLTFEHLNQVVDVLACKA